MVAALLLIVLDAVESCAARGYVVTQLGTLSGFEDVYPHAINESGQIVGTMYDEDSGATTGFLFGTGTPSRLALTDAVDINDVGQVAGIAVVGGSMHAFLLSGPTRMDAGTLGGPTSQAAAIDRSGRLAGVAVDAAGRRHVITFAGGTLSDRGALRSRSDGLVWDMNDAGQIVGTDEFNGDLHGYLLSGATKTDLGTFGGRGSQALAINNTGVIVGYAYNRADWPRAFRYLAGSAGGSLVDLGTLGGESSRATAINDLGQIVGESDTTVYDPDLGGYETHGFVWEAGVMTDLCTLVSRPTCIGLRPKAINDRGQIAAEREDDSGYTRGLLLTPGDVPTTTSTSTVTTSTTSSTSSARGAFPTDTSPPPTTPPCKTARCALDDARRSAACAGHQVPSAVGTKLDKAVHLIEQAAGSSAKKAKKLLRQAKSTLRAASKAAARAARGKKAKLPGTCATALEDAADGVIRGLGV